MPDSVKDRLLADERKLIELLSAAGLPPGIAATRNVVLQRIEDDDGTLTERELRLTFISKPPPPLNQIKLALSRIREQDGRCVPIRAEWLALLKARNDPSS
jgi:hypothetical protein